MRRAGAGPGSRGAERHPPRKAAVSEITLVNVPNAAWHTASPQSVCGHCRHRRPRVAITTAPEGASPDATRALQVYPPERRGRHGARTLGDRGSTAGCGASGPQGRTGTAVTVAAASEFVLRKQAKHRSALKRPRTRARAAISLAVWLSASMLRSDEKAPGLEAHLR